MSDRELKKNSGDDFPKRVRSDERRKLRARRQVDRSHWLGFGLFGIVGWSIAVPTTLGAFLGLYIDANVEGPRSWTLMLVIIGLLAGCATAWFWVGRERDAILKQSQEEPDEGDHE